MRSFLNCSLGHSPPYLSPVTVLTPYAFSVLANSATTASGENGGLTSRTASTTATPSDRWPIASVKLSTVSEPARGALDLLAPTYRWFTEGFENPDLQEAKLLLDQP